MREELPWLCSPANDSGITPACAGRTFPMYSHHFHDKDHPRVCGKNPAAHYPIRMSVGSPPRVREEPFSPSGISQRSRITPACAGRTLSRAPDPHVLRDHPRVCGKNYLQRKSLHNANGSPPRVREEPNFSLAIKA